MEKRVGIRFEGDASGFNAATAQAEAAQRKLAEATAATEAVVRRTTITTGQYQQAVRMLPMQVTDVVTSLASGMPVWMVAIQQGGQIRDSFGGAGNALKYLTSQATSARLAIGGLGTAALTAVVAFEQGRREVEAYQKAIIMTGNAASLTAGMLDSMARRMDAASFGTTQGQAASGLAQMAGTGQVGRGQIEQATQVAIELQRTLGIEVEKTVAAFAELGRDPLNAVIKLNAQQNFLTLEVYEQIKALTEQKRFAEAAALAQTTLAETTRDRLKQVEDELGYLDRGWRAITSTAREAWDAMRGLGRQRTLESELEDVQARLAMPINRGVDPRRAEAGREALRQREAELQELIRIQRREADKQGQQAAAVQEAIARDRENARKPRAGRAEIPGAIQSGGEQVQSDFLRSEKAAYEQLAAADRRAAEEQARSAELMARQRERERLRAVEAIEQLGEANRRANAEAITDAQARGQTLIALEEQEMRRRIDIAALGVEERQQLEEELATWRLNRERQLTEELKPEWQRMLDAWRDTTGQMQRNMDETIGGALRRAEDAWVRFATTGKISVKDLVDFVIQQAARAAFQRFIGGILDKLPSFFGSSSTPTLSSNGSIPFIPEARAAGGRVMARRRYRVGENGPEELEMGDEAGFITPNDQLRRQGMAGAGGAVQVTLINQTSQPMQASAQRGADGSLQVLLTALKAGIADDIASGQGSVTQALQGRYGLRSTFASA